MKPILFSTPMVQAILAGSKTQTRRIVQPQPHEDLRTRTASEEKPKLMLVFEEGSKIKAGDALYVRETWCELPVSPGGHARLNRVYYYKADGDIRPDKWRDRSKWRSPRYMPRAAARIFLRVTDVRAERIQDISEEDAKAEGCEAPEPGQHWHHGMELEPIFTARDDYGWLWDDLNAKRGPKGDRARYSWERNPWVWVYTFERITKEEAEDGFCGQIRHDG